jgi:hypothetical protein
MIIGLSGYAKSGKDTVADIILKYESSFQIKKFSAKLKLIASILTGIPVEDFEKQEVKDGYLPDVWNRDNVFFEPHGSAIGDLLHMVITRDRKYQVREFLQELGTEIRDRIHPDAWVNGLMADYGLSTTWVDAKEELFFPNWVISDVRFENEAQAIKDRGGYIIRINRPGVSAVNAHKSETSLDAWNFDEIINNDDTLDILETRVIEQAINKYITL